MSRHTFSLLHKWQQHTITVLLLGAVLTGCATNPVTGGKDVVLMSEQQEIALGKQNHEAILKQYGVYDAPELQAMVERIGQELVRASHRPHLDYTFTLLDSPEVNAFALPGGYIYITRGILAYMNSEEALAGVLGHELGHVTARHSVRQQTAQFGKGLLTTAIAAATGSNRWAQAASTAGTALVSGYGRGHELEADRLGAEYLAKTGYDPESMLEVIGLLKNQETFAKSKAGKAAVSYHGLFASHPGNDRRLQEVIGAAKKYANPDARRRDSETFVLAANNMVFGDSEAQGIVDGNHFYHKDFDLTLAFPADWTLQNSPDNLLGISPDRKQLIQMRLGESDKATQPTQFLQKTFPGLREVQKLQNARAVGVADLDTPWGKKASRVAAVTHKNHTLVLLGSGSEKVPDSGFVSTVKSVKTLQDADRQKASAKHIRVVRAKTGQSYASLAQRSSLGKHAEAQLRLLNNQYPNGELRAGQLIKVVE